MSVSETISIEKENAAIDMMVSMVVEELADILHQTVEGIMPMFLQSKTCETLYDRESKLWWEGPSDIAEQYLREIREKDQAQQ